MQSALLLWSFNVTLNSDPMFDLGIKGKEDEKNIVQVQNILG